MPIHAILRPVNLCVHRPYVRSHLWSDHIADYWCLEYLSCARPNNARPPCKAVHWCHPHGSSSRRSRRCSAFCATVDFTCSKNWQASIRANHSDVQWLLLSDGRCWFQSEKGVKYLSVALFERQTLYKAGYSSKPSLRFLIAKIHWKFAHFWPKSSANVKSNFNKHKQST